MPQEPRTFTLDELKEFDGQDGRPAYVAHKGRVLDATGSKLWKAGRHMNRHQAGLDLTVDLAQAPHAEDVLDRLPQVGVIAEACDALRGDGQDRELPWLFRKHPFFRRHPHPMTVHYPIAFATGAALFLALFWASGCPYFEAGVHAMNMAGVLFTPAAILTGLATWKYNYGASLMTPVRIKLILSPVLLAQFAALVAWWLMNPGVLFGGGPHAVLFAALVLSMLPVMGVIGWCGATLTFPMHE